MRASHIKPWVINVPALAVALGVVMPVAARVPELGAAHVAAPSLLQSSPFAPVYRDTTGADPLYEVQWGLENFGQLGGVIDADIDASAAWEITEGEGDVIVAVFDTGVDLSHPDIAPILWVNHAEASGEPGVDDDGNGCVDDIHGCWFSQGCDLDSKDCHPEPVGAQGDPHGHGTAVAGIIAGAAGNGEGGRGVAPGVRIMALQVATPEGLFWDGPVEEALNYAARMGADVINISAYFDGPDRDRQAEALQAATDAGALIVASAGNWGVDLDTHTDELPFLPHSSNNPAVLNVAAVDRYDALISYAGWWGSDFGVERVPLAGPSQSILTTRPGLGDEAYTYTFNGTSAAAPFVSGVAALVLSVAPHLDALSVRDILEVTVDPVEDLLGKVTTGGRVNANNAVRFALGVGQPPVAHAGVDLEVELGASVALSGRGSHDPDGGALTHRWYLDDGAVAEGENISHRFSHQGIYNVTLEVEDEDGMMATDRVMVTVPFIWRSSELSYESEHPYEPSFVAWVIDIPGARYVRLHFKRLDLNIIENDYVGDDDAVSVVDYTGTPIFTRSTPGEDFWTSPLPTHGMPLELWMDGGRGGAYGMSVDAVEYVNAEDLTEPEGCGGCEGRGDDTPAAAAALLLWAGVAQRRRRRGSKPRGGMGVS